MNQQTESDRYGQGYRDGAAAGMSGQTIGSSTADEMYNLGYETGLTTGRLRRARGDTAVQTATRHLQAKPMPIRGSGSTGGDWLDEEG